MQIPLTVEVHDCEKDSALSIQLPFVSKAAMKTICPHCHRPFDTANDYSAVVREYEAGASIHQLSRRLGVSIASLSTNLRRARARIRPKGRRAAVFPDTILAEYRAGASLHDLADQYGVNANTVCRFLIRKGVEIRPAGRRMPDDRLRHYSDFMELRKAGLTYQAIADRLGVSKQYIGLLAKRLSMAPRAKGGSWK